MTTAAKKTKSTPRLRGVWATDWTDFVKDVYNYGEKSANLFKTQVKKWKKRVEGQIQDLHLPVDRKSAEKMLKQMSLRARDKAVSLLYPPTLHTVRQLEKKLTRLEKQLQKKSAKPSARHAS